VQEIFLISASSGYRAFVFGMNNLKIISHIFICNMKSKQREVLTKYVPLLDYNTNHVSDTAKYLYVFSTVVLAKTETIRLSDSLQR
jgi:hypothetical protein